MTSTPSPVLLRYAGLEVPRYTSYPTAPRFTEAVGDTRYRAWLADLRADEPLSLYLHIPWCRELCWYCGCHTSVARDNARIESYVDDLLAEIDLVAGAMPARMPVAHIHFGGGTPTLLSPDLFLCIMERLNARFDVAPDAEIAVEGDPRTLTQPLVDALAAGGVTRVSLGVQELSPRVQTAINRVQPLETVEAAVAMLRGSGIGALNIDLMYGLPHQSVTDVRATALAVSSLAPDRVSVFGYAHVPWFKKHQRMIDDAALPQLADRWAQAEAAAEVLTERGGLVEIGIDHFARAHDPLARLRHEGRLKRNFQGYTADTASTLIGFGVSSIGALPTAFVQNAREIRPWREAIGERRLPVVRGVELTADDRLRAAVIERIMCDFAADVGAVCAAQGFAPETLDPEIAKLGPLVEDGLAVVDGRTVRVPQEARRLARVVAAGFDAYWQPSPAPRHSVAV